MTFRQIIRPGDTDDVPPHPHDATEISGTFNFFRALRGVITGDITVEGFIRTAKSGARIEIRPDSGTGSVPSIQWFTGVSTNNAFLEVRDVGGGVFALVVDAPGSSNATIFLRDDDSIRVLLNNVESYRLTTTQLLAVDGTAAAPALSFLASGQQDVGFYRAGTDIIGVAVAGTEVARFTAAGLGGAVSAVDQVDEAVSGFTNTAYADLDSLTTAAFTENVEVTATTDTQVLIVISARSARQNTGGNGFVGFRVSGATTVGANDARAMFFDFAAGGASRTFYHRQTLTAGVNTFTLQARVSANSADLFDPVLTVIPL